MYECLLLKPQLRRLKIPIALCTNITRWISVSNCDGKAAHSQHPEHPQIPVLFRCRSLNVDVSGCYEKSSDTWLACHGHNYGHTRGSCSHLSHGLTPHPSLQTAPLLATVGLRPVAPRRADSHPSAALRMTQTTAPWGR